MIKWKPIIVKTGGGREFIKEFNLLMCAYCGYHQPAETVKKSKNTEGLITHFVLPMEKEEHADNCKQRIKNEK